MGRMIDEIGAHCVGMNAVSIGIVFIGNFDEGNVLVDQWNLGLKLTRSLIKTFNIPVENVRGHCDFAGKSCPGKFFDMNKFRREL
jgi:N-acetyl-anhydromuramyl-L-alanine amidase AmpD